MDYIGYVILVRHGESRWNTVNKFTGWIDVPLSETGVKQSIATAKKLHNINIDVAFTSKLSRAQETLLLILAEQKKTGIFLHKNDWKSKWFLRYNKKEFEKDEIPIHSSDKLNERYYGTLQGMNKLDAKERWGEEKVFEWRRGFKERPPKGESLKDVYKRATSYFKYNILKHIRANQNIIISAHGNSLRAILKYLLDINDHDISNINIGFDEPIIFKYEEGELELVSKKITFTRPIEWGKSTKKTTLTITVKKAATNKPKRGSTTSKKSSSIKKKQTTKKKPISKKKTTTKKATKKKTIKKTPVKKKVVAKKKTSKKSTPKKVVKKSTRTKSSSSTKRKPIKKSSSKQKRR